MRSRTTLVVVAACAATSILILDSPSSSAAPSPGSRTALVATASPVAPLPPEIQDSVVNWCSGLDPAWNGFTVGSYQRQIDVDHVAVPICDDPVGPDVDPQTNQVAFGPANVISAVYGPLPAVRGGGTLDYGQAGHPVGSWSMPVVALPAAMRLDYTYTQTSCGAGGTGGCRTGTFPLANLYYDRDPLRTRRLRVAGWPEQDAPGGRVEPLFSARCEAGCSSRPVSLSFSVILADKALPNPDLGARVFELGPFPISLPDATTLRFRLPVPLAVQQQVLAHIRASATKTAEFLLRVDAQAPAFRITSALQVRLRSEYESTSYSPYQPAFRGSVSTGSSSVAAAVSTTGAAASGVRKETLVAQLSPSGLNARSVVVRASGQARTSHVSVTVSLETAVGGTSGRYHLTGTVLKRTVAVRRGRYHLALRLPVTLRSGTVLRALVRSRGANTLSRRSMATTLLTGW